MSALRLARRWLPGGILAAAMLASPGFGQLKTGPGFHSAMPAGDTVVRLEPSGATLALLGLVECPEIEGAQQVSEGLNSRVIAANGVPMKRFPRHFSFRITASLRKTLIAGPDKIVATTEEPTQFLLKLGFRLKVYNGLEQHQVAPESVKLIGMPAEIAYDERVFRVSFDLENLPVTDRLVLEILSPEDETLTHFSFGLL